LTKNPYCTKLLSSKKKVDLRLKIIKKFKVKLFYGRKTFMKRRLLLLAGLLALGATSFAAEGTRDFLDNFKDNIAPKEDINGYWTQEFKAYGDQEGKENKQMRLENEFGVNLTDKLSLGLRTRTYMNYPGRSNASDDNFRIDATYDHGKILGELGFSQRVRFYKGEGGEGTFSYSPEIDFGYYLGEKGWGSFNFEYLYSRNTGDTDGQVLKYDLDFGWDLGYGFSNEIEFTGGKNLVNSADDLHALFLALYYDYTLWTSINETTTFDFHGEVSATPVKFDSDGTKNKNGKKFDVNSTVVDGEFYLRLNKEWHSSFSTYVQAGLTASKDLSGSLDTAPEFGLQGYGALGLSYSF
jgi:hypothetical protein